MFIVKDSWNLMKAHQKTSLFTFAFFVMLVWKWGTVQPEDNMSFTLNSYFAEIIYLLSATVFALMIIWDTKEKSFKWPCCSFIWSAGLCIMFSRAELSSYWVNSIEVTPSQTVTKRKECSVLVSLEWSILSSPSSWLRWHLMGRDILLCYWRVNTFLHDWQTKRTISRWQPHSVCTEEASLGAIHPSESNWLFWH